MSKAMSPAQFIPSSIGELEDSLNHTPGNFEEFVDIIRNKKSDCKFDEDALRVLYNTLISEEMKEAVLSEISSETTTGALQEVDGIESTISKCMNVLSLTPEAASLEALYTSASSAATLEKGGNFFSHILNYYKSSAVTSMAPTLFMNLLPKIGAIYGASASREFFGAMISNTLETLLTKMCNDIENAVVTKMLGNIKSDEYRTLNEGKFKEVFHELVVSRHGSSNPTDINALKITIAEVGMAVEGAIDFLNTIPRQATEHVLQMQNTPKNMVNPILAFTQIDAFTSTTYDQFAAGVVSEIGTCFGTEASKTFFTRTKVKKFVSSDSNLGSNALETQMATNIITDLINKKGYGLEEAFSIYKAKYEEIISKIDSAERKVDMIAALIEDDPISAFSTLEVKRAKNLLYSLGYHLTPEMKELIESSISTNLAEITDVSDIIKNYHTTSNFLVKNISTQAAIDQATELVQDFGFIATPVISEFIATQMSEAFAGNIYGFTNIKAIHETYTKVFDPISKEIVRVAAMRDGVKGFECAAYEGFPALQTAPTAQSVQEVDPLLAAAAVDTATEDDDNMAPLDTTSHTVDTMGAASDAAGEL